MASLELRDIPWLEIIIGTTHCFPVRPHSQTVTWRLGAATLHISLPSRDAIDIRLDQEVFRIAVSAASICDDSLE